MLRTSPTGRRVDDSLADSSADSCPDATRPAESRREACELPDRDVLLPFKIYHTLFLLKLPQQPPTSHVKMQLPPEPPEPIKSKFEQILGATWPQDDHHDDMQQKGLRSLPPSFSQRRLLPFLSTSSLLALRLVSKTTKSWVDNGPRCTFSTLYLPFPFKIKEYAKNASVPSRQASKECEKLVVNVAASDTRLKTMYNIFWAAGTLPRYSSLKHLHVNAPSSSSFWPLLELRMFIQAVDSPELRRFSVNGLSIEGLEALRWGPLTSYLDADWDSSVMWRQLTNLDISLAPSMGIADSTRSEEITRGMKILHDWIGSFDQNQFEKVRFEWMGGQKRPNPFLLDELAEMHGSKGEPKMRRISWSGCKEIWLGGVRLGTKDSRKMMDRVNGLNRVMVWTSLLGRKIKAGERKVYSRGQEWVAIKLSDRRRNETHSTNGNAMPHDTLGETAREYYEETEPQQVSHGQTLESVADMSEGGVGKTFGADSDDALSDTSREVPFYLDCM